MRRDDQRVPAAGARRQVREDDEDDVFGLVERMDVRLDEVEDARQGIDLLEISERQRPGTVGPLREAAPGGGEGMRPVLEHQLPVPTCAIRRPARRLLRRASRTSCVPAASTATSIDAAASITAPGCRCC